MRVTQRCQYALRAIFELARRNGRGPIKIADIAEVQAIPQRFLEVILSQLKHGGFVDSQRGTDGGYFLKRDPADLTVGEVMRFMQGFIGPVSCVLNESEDNKCVLYGDCAFIDMWKEVQRAMTEIYDNTTFKDLVERDQQRKSEYLPYYSI